MYCLFSAKGGVGCSVITTALALLSAERQPTLLVDLRGDLDTILGLAPVAEGLTDWFRIDQPSPDLLHRIEVPVSEKLSLLPRGSCRSPARPDRYRLLAHLLRHDARTVVVDVGTHAVPAVALLSEATSTLLVTRACYLALRAAQKGPTPDGIVLVVEGGRAFRRSEVISSVGAPIEVELPWDRSVARAVDSGLLGARMPRTLRALERML